MRWRAAWYVVAATAGGWAVASAQVVDSAAAAVGIYRPALPSDTGKPPGTAKPPRPSGDSLRSDSVPLRGVGDSLADTARGDTAAADSIAKADSRVGAAAADSIARADSTVGDSAAADSIARADASAVDTARVADTVRKENALQLVDEPEEDDTSLTARMDASRGGGLARAEFPDLLSSATMTGRYRTFLGLVNRSSLQPMLTGRAPITLLAPTDSAFTKLSQANLARLRNDAAFRDAWLKTLVLNGSLKSRDLVRTGNVRSRSGAVVYFSERDSVVRAGPARLVQPDLVARNGVLHGVDRVVLPGATSASP